MKMRLTDLESDIWNKYKPCNVQSDYCVVGSSSRLYWRFSDRQRPSCQTEWFGPLDRTCTSPSCSDSNMIATPEESIRLFRRMFVLLLVDVVAGENPNRRGRSRKGSNQSELA